MRRKESLTFNLRMRGKVLVIRSFVKISCEILGNLQGFFEMPRAGNFKITFERSIALGTPRFDAALIVAALIPENERAFSHVLFRMKSTCVIFFFCKGGFPTSMARSGCNTAYFSTFPNHSSCRGKIFLTACIEIARSTLFP